LEFYAAVNSLHCGIRSAASSAFAFDLPLRDFAPLSRLWVLLSKCLSGFWS